MPIKRNAGAGGNYIKQPGEYRVRVRETKNGESKSKKPMLTVTLSTSDDRTINCYFTKGTFQMHSLKELKVACGLDEKSPAENLIGRECGILVEAQDPTDDGKVFMHVVGYGPAVEAQPSAVDAHQDVSDDEIPF